MFLFLAVLVLCFGCLSSVVRAGGKGSFLSQKEILDAVHSNSSSVSLLEDYDVLDIGASKGRGSMEFLLRALTYNFGVNKTQEYKPKTLGIDIDERKVALCKAAGNDCIVGDATKLNTSKSTTKVDGITTWHALEHMPNCKLAEDIWQKSSLAARHFTLFHGPNFDDQYALGSFHRYYENWTGHTCHFNSTLLERSIRTSLNPSTRFIIVASKPIHSSNSSVILPKGSSRNSHHYDTSIHAPKENYTFPIIMYEEMRACAMYKSESSSAKMKMNLLAALCMRDALKFSGKVLACQSPGTKTLTECMSLLKKESDSVINDVKHSHSTNDGLFSGRKKRQARTIFGFLKSVGISRD